MRWKWVSAALAVMFTIPVSSAFGATPWEQLMGRKPRTWTAERGNFSLDLPVGWHAVEEEEVPVRFHRTDEGSGIPATVQVEVRPLPGTVKSKHFHNHILAETRKKARGFRRLDHEMRNVDGQDGHQTFFRYRVYGNTELSRDVVQTTYVTEDVGVIITFETVAGAKARFWEEVSLMLDGFHLGQAGGPSVDTKTGRRRVRAGEMIHPDAVRY